jgi:hypothetical protein
MIYFLSTPRHKPDSNSTCIYERQLTKTVEYAQVKIKTSIKGYFLMVSLLMFFSVHNLWIHLNSLITSFRGFHWYLNLFLLVSVWRGWRKMRHSLTFYFIDFILVWNVSCYICLSCIVRHGILRFEGINENHENWWSTNSNEFIGYVRKRTWANLPLPLKYSSSSNTTTKGKYNKRHFKQV